MNFGAARVAPEKAVFRPALPLSVLPGLNGTGMATYSELLRDPRWQKIRLKKLEAADWRCERCMDAETTLNVHHKRYVKGRMPWEYDEAELAVLCEPCHEAEHESKDLRTELLARLDMDGPLGVDGFMAYGAGAVSMRVPLQDPLWELCDAIRDTSPLQFWAGQVAAQIIGLADTVGGTVTVNTEELSDALRTNEAFVAELRDLLRRHGVWRADREGS
jgi:hypothetical protein